MLKSIEGIYRGGHVELLEKPEDIDDDTRVIVTFLTPRLIDLRAHGIDKAQAVELRARLASFATDWDDPDMDIYDEYDVYKTKS